MGYFNTFEIELHCSSMQFKMSMKSEVLTDFNYRNLLHIQLLSSPHPAATYSFSVYSLLCIKQ